MNRTVIITGATSGIGRATAKVLAAQGCNLLLTGRRKDRLKKLAEELSSKGIQVSTHAFDVRNYASCKSFADDVEASGKTIDLLLNNAGLASGLSSIEEGSLEDWETMIDTNIKGLLYMTRVISPLLKVQGHGMIINVCSTAGKEVYPKGNVYCATKHAVDALTKSTRLDLYTHGIRVGQVSPGHVEETEFAKVRFHGDAERAKIYEDFNPLRSSDVADVISFMFNQPKHVNIQDILMMGTQQAGSNFIDRSGRKYDS